MPGQEAGVNAWTRGKSKCLDKRLELMPGQEAGVNAWARGRSKCLDKRLE
jgi:hypothetical protein